MISGTTNRIRYSGNGVLDTYPYPFQILANSDLIVYVAGTLQTLDVQYTVTEAGEVDGGNVVFGVDHIPANEAIIVIIRNLPTTQLVDYTSGGRFPAETHETALDRLVMINQRLLEKLGRVPMIAETLGLSGIELAEPGAGKYLRWNVAGDGIDAIEAVEDLGNFTQSGTGAVSRTAISKMGEVRSVKDFGAAGDGVTDDTNAFTDALAAINPTDGGALYVPSGNYNANVVINGRNNLRIFGDGLSTQIEPDAGSAFTITNSEYMRMSNLVAKGPGPGLNIAGSAQSIFEKLWVEVSTNDAIYIDGDENCEMTFRDALMWSGDNKVCFHYVRTDGVDTGGIYLFNVRAGVGASATGKNGFKFESSHSSITNIYVMLANTVADAFTENAYVFDNVGNINGVDVWGAITGDSKAVMYINNCSAMRLIAPRLANNHASGYIVEIDEASIDINLIDMLAYGADGITVIYFAATFTGNNVRVHNPYAYVGSYTFTNTSAHLVNSNIFSGNSIYPAVDNVFYLGKNDDDSPFAWKGVILKDTTDGKYYRIEVINGVVTATDLSD